jgi:hypothetical protein
MPVDDVATVFDYVRYACYHYTATHENKKKMKTLLMAVPFFMPTQYQNSLFTIIVRNPVDSYVDDQQTMCEYGYLIYKEFHTDNNMLPVKSYVEYLQGLHRPLDNRAKIKQAHNIIFVCVLLGLLCGYYYAWVL